MKKNEKNINFALLHDSAIQHVTGEAIYINDMDVSQQMLTGHLLYSPVAHGIIKKFNCDAALKLPGVLKIITYKDIPGENQVGPVVHDEPCLAENEVNFIGQPIALIAAENIDIARKAAKLIELEIESLDAIVDLETAIARKNLIAPERKISRGDFDTQIKKCKHTIKGTFRSNGQEHWYLETQSALAVPGEKEEMKIFASSQNPAETQAIVAEVLGIPRNQVEVEVRRLGGGFGGKETQGNHIAAWCALLAFHTKRSVKMHLSRDDDQLITGKRHRYLSNYEIGFDDKGLIQAYSVELNADAGSSTDLSTAILERAMLHAENAYYIPHIKIVGRAYKTNLPSNTAFRGFGGPQGIAAIENAIEKIAFLLKKEAVKIRELNFYQQTKNNTTPYEQKIQNNRLQDMYAQIISISEYEKQRKEVDEYNKKHEFSKQGLALVPVKFGISFTTSFLNQAGALVHIYQDGTVQVNHGGVEMGQGINVKMQQIAALELGIASENIKVTATNTSKVPNTSATAASSGSDLNGMAIRNAIEKLKYRLADVAVAEINEQYSGMPTIKDDIVFEHDFVFDKSKLTKKIKFKELVLKAYFKQVSMSATGFYRTPDIYFNRQEGKGMPFHYFSYGMAASRVQVDALTGELKILSTHIIQDVGDSIHAEIDKGQIMGAFIQGVGWCTSEELKWSKNGYLVTHSPDTYKIPTIRDIPQHWVVELMRGVPNPNTIRKSKAIGEPPFMLGLAVWLAIKDAILAKLYYSRDIEFEIPATNEKIVMWVEEN